MTLGSRDPPTSGVFLNLTINHNPPMKLLACLGVLASAWAFSDTAPAYAGIGKLSSNYIVQLSEVAGLIKQYSEQVCQDGNSDKLFIYRVSGLVREEPASEITSVQHVHFDLADNLDFDVASSCHVAYRQYTDAIGNIEDANIVFVDVDDGKQHRYTEFVGKNGEEAAYVVQGKPLFKKQKHGVLESLVEMKEDFDQLLKRGYESDEEVEESALFDEVEADFRAAQSMIAQEESMVTAYAEDEGAVQAAGKNLNLTGKANLFTEYQFFTPGVWLSLIVSLFLLYVITTAVGWVTSIETSYNAFEKQVDYEKKTE